jgi:hypothetical protein
MRSGLALDWSRYTLVDDTVAKEIGGLQPYRFTTLELPELGSEDFALLLDSIRANGVLEALTVTPDARVVDGRARLRAATTAGIHTVRTRVLYAQAGEEDYALWAAAVNIGRRHLSAAQRLMLVESMLSVLEGRARRRQEVTRFGRVPGPAGSNGQPPVSPDLTSPNGSADVRSQVAALTGVSRGQAAKIISLVKHGSPALREAVASGRMSVHRAHATLRRPQQRRTVRAANRRSTAAVRTHLTREPIQTRRTVAALIPQWTEQSADLSADELKSYWAALENVAESCDLSFRRLAQLATPAAQRRSDRAVI